MSSTHPVLGAPCWAELGTTDLAGAAAFYAQLFGWTAEEDQSPEAGGYTMLLLDGDPVAAMTPLYQESQPVSWTMSVSVADADAVADRVREHGGTVLLDPMGVFDLGRFAVVADPGGAVFSLWQARTFQGAARLYETGALCWVELATSDPGAAREFYASVLGWGARPEGDDDYVHWGVDGRDFGGMVRMNPDRYPPELHPVPPHWTLYFAVEDVDACVARATKAGGRGTFPAMDIPGTGRVAGLLDPQGGAFALYTPASHLRADRSQPLGLTPG